MVLPRTVKRKIEGNSTYFVEMFEYGMECVLCWWNFSLCYL